MSAKTKRESATKRAAVKLGPRFLRAVDFAFEKHAGQTRKASTIPYIAHLMGVASLVLEFGGDEDMAIAALLQSSPSPSEEQVAALPNICRCGAYPRIRKAIARAIQATAATPSAPGKP